MKVYLFIAILAFNYANANSNIHILPYGSSVDALKFIKESGILPENPTIIDAGAYDGQESLMMATKFWPKGLVYSFEPVPDIYDRLVKNTRGIENIRPIQLALSDSNGSAKFYLSYEETSPYETSMSSSLLTPKDHLLYSSTKFGGCINVQTITLDQWAIQNNISHIDFLWLDLQGFELRVLKSSPKILSTVKAIFLEVEFVEAYTNQHKYEEISNWLEDQGFVMIARNFKEPMEISYSGSIIWFGDVLFVRKNTKEAPCEL